MLIGVANFGTGGIWKHDCPSVRDLWAQLGSIICVSSSCMAFVAKKEVEIACQNLSNTLLFASFGGHIGCYLCFFLPHSLCICALWFAVKSLIFRIDSHDLADAMVYVLWSNFVMVMAFFRCRDCRGGDFFFGDTTKQRTFITRMDDLCRVDAFGALFCRNCGSQQRC